MIATITAALVTLCAAVTAQAEAIVRRIHDATSSLISLDRQMIGKLTRTVVPEIIYREYKSLYLELRTARCSPAAPPMARGAAPPRDVRVLRGEVFGALGVRGTPMAGKGLH